MSKLTARRVETLKEPGHYVDGDGLALVIGRRGGKSWVLRTMVRGKRRDIGLGGVSWVSLAEAREKAREVRKIAREGGELRRDLPEIALCAEIGMEPEIIQGLIEGRIDIGVMYTPQRRPNLDVVPLMDERLVLVSSAAQGTIAAPEYIHVDWGPEFSAQYDASFPDAPGPGLSVNIGWLGLRHMLDRGGSGYFPERMVAGLIAEGLLVRVSGAPAFALPAYVVHAAGPQGETVSALRDRLMALAAEIAGQGLATRARGA